MTHALDCERPTSPNRTEKFTQVVDMLFRNNALEKIAKHEAATREQVRKSDQELRDLADWLFMNRFKLGDIGNTVSDQLDWEEPP
jgi:hypothetical protein